MKFDVELTEIYEDGALVIVEGDDWIVAIPFTTSDNKVSIDTDNLTRERGAKPLSERIAQKISDHDSIILLRPDISPEIQELVQLEGELEKRLRQEYMDEDHRLGGIGITFEQFRTRPLLTEEE